MELHTVRGTVPVTAPFDFGKSLSFVCAFSPTAGEQCVGERSLAKAIVVRERAILFELTESGRPDRLAYALHAHAPIDDALRDAALARIRFHLSLDDDLAPFYALADRDASFRP